MSFKEWVVELFKDERGSISIKPVVALIGTLILCSVMVLNAVSTKPPTLSSDLINAVMIITSVGMGADTFDKFSKKTPNGNSDNGNGTPTT